MATEYLLSSYCLAATSLFICTAIIVSLRLIDARSYLSKCIFYLNLLKIIEIISCFPNISLGNRVGCQVAAYFYYVSSMGNLMTSLSINIYFYVIMLKQEWVDWIQINEYHKLELIVFAFPIVLMLIPFMLKDVGDIGYSAYTYGDEGISICVLSHNADTTELSLGILYIWVWLAMACIATSYMAILIHVCCLTHFVNVEILKRSFRTFGIYSIITFFCWIPRTIKRLDGYLNGVYVTSPFYVYLLPMYLATWCYGVCYFLELKNLRVYEKNNKMSASFFYKGIHDQDDGNDDDDDNCATNASDRADSIENYDPNYNNNFTYIVPNISKTKSRARSASSNTSNSYTSETGNGGGASSSSSSSYSQSVSGVTSNSHRLILSHNTSSPTIATPTPTGGRGGGGGGGGDGIIMASSSAPAAAVGGGGINSYTDYNNNIINNNINNNSNNNNSSSNSNSNNPLRKSLI